MAGIVSGLARSMNSLRGFHHDDTIAVDEMNGTSIPGLEEARRGIQEILQAAVGLRKRDGHVSDEGPAIVQCEVDPGAAARRKLGFCFAPTAHLQLECDGHPGDCILVDEADATVTRHDRQKDVVD